MYIHDSEIKAIINDVNEVVENVKEAKKDAQRGQNGLGVFNGLENEDDLKIEHLQGCIGDVSYELDNMQEKLQAMGRVLSSLIDNAEYEEIMKKILT